MKVNEKNTEASPEEETLKITRIFNAPRELVFKVWTLPQHIIHWWGPKNFTVPSCEVDLNVNGEFHFCMRSPDGKEYWSKGVFREIIFPEKIQATMYFSDEDGNILDPEEYGMGSDVPKEMLDTIRFEEIEDNKTRLTFHRNTPLSVSKRYGEDEGWNQSLDKFEKEVAEITDRSIIITREFSFNRKNVFEAWTQADSLEAWWGPEGFKTTTVSMDFQPGGSWHHIMHGPDGTDYDNKLIYIEIQDGERIVYINKSGDNQEQARFLTTITFTERENKTKINLHMIFDSEEECKTNKEDFEAVKGGNQTLQRLEEYLGRKKSVL